MTDTFTATEVQRQDDDEVIEDEVEEPTIPIRIQNIVATVNFGIKLDLVSSFCL